MTDAKKWAEAVDRDMRGGLLEGIARLKEHVAAAKMLASAVALCVKAGPPHPQFLHSELKRYYDATEKKTTDKPKEIWVYPDEESGWSIGGRWCVEFAWRDDEQLYVHADLLDSVKVERKALIQDLASYQEMQAELLSEIDRLKAERDLMAKKLELSEAMMDDRLAQMAHQFAKQMGKL